MNNTGYLQTSSLDFDDLKTSLKTFLSQQQQFKDWNFEGSNMSVLLDLLTYNTTLNALYLNLVGSETFMDSAQLRESLVSHAKDLNYAPRSRTSAFIEMNVQLSGNNIPGVVTLPAGFAVNGVGSQGSSMQFVTDTVTVLSSENNWSANANFYEGRIISETFIANSEVGQSSIFSLESANVDTTSISVVVQNSTSDSTNTIWSAADWASYHNGNDAVWFLQGYKDNYYSVVFGNGTIGKSLTPGNVVQVSYRETSGDGGNGITNFTAVSNTGITGVGVGLTNITAMSTGGNERESNNSIRFSAPRFMQSQGRAVTLPDYEDVIQDKFPQFQTVAAYGGEDAYPQKKYGTVIVSGKLPGLNYVPDTIVDAVLDYVGTLAPLGLAVSFAQPDVYSLQLDCDVIYDPTKSNYTYAEIMDAITDAIITFDADNLNVFGGDLWSSKLEAAITSVDPSIQTADFSVYMTKNYSVVANSRPQSFSFTYQNPIFYPFLKKQAYPDNYAPAFSSSQFIVNGKNALFADDGTGMIDVVDASNTTAVLIQNIGTIDYDKGDVSISPLVITSAVGNAIAFAAHLSTEDVRASSSQILSIDINQTSINLTAE